MLQIESISKKYKTGELIQTALDGVSLNLRDNEFVAILGPSGSGKTTLLNIIGGLDRYDSGDLVIGGVSTKKYKDRDWDSYRNHTIGFVFQSYNLIPHQTVLANVELALTIGGISRSERRNQAKKALEKVGLGNQLHKKPNQMSGGQMQRVAIARALVNDPDILLADEPTGALDTETSIQVMELLKEVAKERLVVMVTHNPELAEEYATRIVRLRDGKITDDTDPFLVDNTKLAPPEHKNLGKASMSFFTSLSLSFNNLRTKKGRTLLTAFAGSIGIIGIALILALSAGVNNYIADVQKDTMTSYPITINAETVDLSSMMGKNSGKLMGGASTNSDTSSTEESTQSGVYADNSKLKSASGTGTSVTENNLTPFKKYLDDSNSDIHKYIGESGIVYSYDAKFNVFAKDANGTTVDTDSNPDPDSSTSSAANGGGMAKMSSRLSGTSPASGAKNFEELTPGADGKGVSQVVKDSYDVVYGSWPQNANEVVLVLDKNNSIPTATLYQLGIITKDQYKSVEDQMKNGDTVDSLKWDYSELCSHTFQLIPASDYFIDNGDGTFKNVKDDKNYQDQLLDNSYNLKIVGVIRPVKDAKNATLSSAVAYTSALTNYVIDHTNSSAVIQAQEKTPDTNVLNGLNFDAATDDAKIAQATSYISKLNISDKAAMYTSILYTQSSKKDAGDSSASGAATTAGTQATGTGTQAAGTGAQAKGMQAQGASGKSAKPMDETALAAAMDKWLEKTPDNTVLLSVYNQYVSGSTYDNNMTNFGKVSYDKPKSISIYTDSFENKDAVSDCITQYNKTADKDNQITYTDYVALLTSSLTSIVNIISYVLIAFVSVSLVVSCIMIGIITHISVLERTKEIGILRALGASKRNISQVFNAETFIIGICSGIIGVGISILLTIPINAVINSLLGADTLKANLQPGYAVVLIAISMFITVLGGLLPAKKAAKKDPVIALRTE